MRSVLYGKRILLLLFLVCFIFFMPKGFAQRIVYKNPMTLVRAPQIPLKAIETRPEKITFTCEAPQYSIKTLKDNVLVQVKGYELTLSPGDPMLPFIDYEAALPPNVDPKSVTLHYDITKSMEITGQYVIKPAPPLQTLTEKGDIIQYWGLNKNIVRERNLLVYKSDKAFPRQPVTLEAFSQMRKWNFVRVRFIPVRYYPGTGKLVYIQSVNVTVSYRLLKTPAPVNLLKDTVMDKEAQSRFINFKQVDKLRWYKPAGFEPVPAVGPGDYVIITTNAIVSNSTALADFINHKTYLGHNVQLVTEDDYGTLVGQAPNGTAEKIRQWLMNNYLALGTKWVLLIGNPDPDNPADAVDTFGDIPMKMCWPHRFSSSYQDCPTDYFYANLSGNWDLDGDGFYGESQSITAATSPDSTIGPETFSVRWTGRIEASSDGNYSFYAYSDEGIRLRIDGTLVIDNWVPHLPANDSGSVALTAGMHDIEIEYFDLTGDGMLIITWREPGGSKAYLPADKLYHLSGGSYVAGGLDGEYFNNEDLTGSVLTRVDSSFYFSWGTGDDGAGGVDFTQDVYVGRIPVYNDNYADLDSILQKIITYESVTEIPAWRRRILLAMKPSDDSTPGWDLGENIKDDSAVPTGLGYFRIYDDDYGLTPAPESTPCTVANVVAEWPDAYGMMTWFTHGGPTSASSLFNSASCSSLDNTRPSFTYQASCYNGYPESDNNLGYALLREGAIATVSASRVSWYAPGIYDDMYLSWGINQTMAYFYTKAILGGITAGQSLFAMKSGSGGWMNNMDYNLYGDPSTALFTAYEAPDVDIIPVLDHSGSMSGYTSSSNTDKKIDILKEAANHFVDMMAGDSGHQFGLVKFSTTATTPYTLQAFTEGSKAGIHTIINGLSPTNLTSIGDGLNHAVTQFTTNGIAAHRRVILLVTDGMENRSPWITDIQPSLVSDDITVFPLGLGYSYNINETKLIDLAAATGGDYRITDDDLIFRKYFIEVLCEAATWSVVTDPIFNLSGGQQKTLSVPVCSEDGQVIFTIYWSDYDNAVDLTMKAPNGQLYTANASASNYTYEGKTRYAFYKFDLSRLPAAQRNGTWTMQAKARTGVFPADKSVRLSASVLAKNGAQISVNLDSPVIDTGARNLLQVRLAHLGKPLKSAKVQAVIDAPKTGWGNIIRYNPVAVKKIEVSREAGLAEKSQLQLKTELIQKKLGKEFMPREEIRIPLYDDGTHGDRRKNDGIYSAVIQNTKIPGLYNIRILVTAEINGKKTTREWTKTFRSTVAVDPRFSALDLKTVSVSKRKNTYKLAVAPKDRFGNFMGPGHTVEIINVDGKRMELTDNLDSTYSADLSVAVKQLKKGDVIQVLVDDKPFTEVKLSR